MPPEATARGASSRVAAEHVGGARRRALLLPELLPVAQPDEGMAQMVERVAELRASERPRLAALEMAEGHLEQAVGDLVRLVRLRGRRLRLDGRGGRGRRRAA